jgi:hybrid cluster-associated redox disulfide protein
MKISAKTHIAETFKMSKDILKVYEKYGLECPGCKGAGEDTVEIAALNYGLDLNQFLNDLNKAVK